MEEEMEKPKGIYDFIVRYWWIWIPIVILIFVRGKYGLIQFDKATFYVAAWIIFASMSFLMWTELKHKTPKLIANPYHTTVDITDIYEVGHWYVIRAGSVKAMGLYWPGREGAVVVPKTGATFIGPNVAITPRLKIIDKKYLDPAVKKVLEDERIPSPYRIGYVSEAQIQERPEIDFMIQQEEKRNAYINKLEELLEKHGLTTEKEVTQAARIYERTRGGWAKIKEKMIEE